MQRGFYSLMIFFSINAMNEQTQKHMHRKYLLNILFKTHQLILPRTSRNTSVHASKIGEAHAKIPPKQIHLKSTCLDR